VPAPFDVAPPASPLDTSPEGPLGGLVEQAASPTRTATLAIGLIGLTTLQAAQGHRKQLSGVQTSAEAGMRRLETIRQVPPIA